MNKIKQYLGFVWMVLSVVLVLFMLYQAYIKVDAAAAGISKTNTLLQWVIILLVFLPICAGLFIFGKYALAKEYDRLDNQWAFLLDFIAPQLSKSFSWLYCKGAIGKVNEDFFIQFFSFLFIIELVVV